MTDDTRYLSQFSAEEQRAAIALTEEHMAYTARKTKLENVVKRGREFLAARPHIEALHKSPILAAFAEELARAQEKVFAEERAIIQTAESGLDELAVDWLSLGPRIRAQYEAFTAVRNFLKESESQMPVVYDDIVWGEALCDSIHELQRTLERDLAGTRQFLSEHNPAALQTRPFRLAASYLDEGWDCACSVYEVADKYREFRATFARLRAEATKPNE